jgi:hypothetical protein
MSNFIQFPDFPGTSGAATARHFIAANIPMISRPNHCDQGKREAELQGLVACALMMLDAFSDQVQRSWLCGNPQQ